MSVEREVITYFDILKCVGSPIVNMKSKLDESPNDAWSRFVSLQRESELFYVDYDAIVSARDKILASNEALDTAYLDLPFRTVWLEYANNTTQEYDAFRNLNAILFHEESPGVYITALVLGGIPNLPPELVERVRRSGTFPEHMRDEIQLGRLTRDSQPEKDWRYLVAMFRALSSSKYMDWGEERVNQHVKTKGLGKKDAWKIRRIIHLRPKGAQATFQTCLGGLVNWKQHWRVRGHWRQIGALSVGKDRAGSYCIPGATWVVDHEKGPETAPCQAKARILSAGPQRIREN